MLPWLPAGGAEAVVYEVVKALREERGIECTIVTSVPNEHEWHDRFHALTHRIYHLPNFLPQYAWESFVINMLQTRGIRKLLLSASEFGYTVLPSIKRSVPDLQVYNLLHNDSDLGYFRHSVQYNNHIETHIGVSRSIANKLEKVGGIEQHKIRVIYNGVDLDDRFDPDSIERKAMCDKFGIPRGAHVVAYIGRLSTEKQPLEFVRLAAALKDTRDARFVLVGDGVLRDDVAQAIRAAGLEHQLYWWRDVAPEEVPHVLAVTDVLVIPSSSEGFPMVMLEALAMQVPVVSYDVGEVRAAVTNGVNGWVVPAGDFQALSRHVAELLSQPSLRGHLRARARESVRERGFTRAEMIRGYLEIIDGQRTLRQAAVGHASDLRG